jgi:carboxyl-terminal processing protease
MTKLHLLSSQPFSPKFRSRSLLALTSALALISIPILTSRAKAILQDSPKVVLDEAWQIVNQEYVDPTFNQVDWQQVHHNLLAKTYTSPEEAYSALRDALKQLNDPYTRFMNPEEFQAFQNSTRGELVGVGMQLDLDKQTQALTVVKPIENSPALRAGVQAGDRILQIDGQTTQGMAVDKAAALIRGQANTSVKLVLQRQTAAPFELTLTREQITLPTAVSALRIEGGHRVGYIRLAEFSSHAAEQMEQAITTLKSQNADEFVLDLRGNPGGRLDQAVDIARMWLDSGDIVRTVDRNGNAEQMQARHTALTQLPLAVLVDGGSASASEILTGALKDDHRAVVVGTQTFGKALVQQVHPLADGSGLNVTIAHYFTPSGLDINHKGITPDFVVSLTDAQKQNLSSHPDQIGTAQDPQYAKAVAQLAASGS